MSAGKKERWALRQFGVGRRRRPGRIGRGWGRVSGDAALTRSLRLLCLNASSALGSADMMMGARVCTDCPLEIAHRLLAQSAPAPPLDLETLRCW